MRFLKAWSERRGKSLGQSLVEFTLLLPLLLMMLSGLIEFGFMLNFYLDLVDGAREVARFAADDDPLHDAAGAWIPCNTDFYTRVWANTDRALNWGGQVVLDPAQDDVIVSIFTLAGGTVVARFPTVGGCPSGPLGSGGGEVGWRRWGNYDSKFTTAQFQTLVTNHVTEFGAVPPNTGVVLVEIVYNYNMVLGLPWITAFVQDPIVLHAYSIMPNSAAEPTPTP